MELLEKKGNFKIRNILIDSFCLFIFSVLLVLIRYFVEKNEIFSYISCNVLLLFASVVWSRCKREIYLHVIVISAVTLYQFYFFTHKIQVNSEYEYISIVLFILLFFGFEFPLLIISMDKNRMDQSSVNLELENEQNDNFKEENCCNRFINKFCGEYFTDVYRDENFRETFSFWASIFYLMGIAIPIKNVGILKMDLSSAGLASCLWVTFAISEFYKQKQRKDIILPPSASKASLLLYLPKNFWFISVICIITNFYLIKTERKNKK